MIILDRNFIWNLSAATRANARKRQQNRSELSKMTADGAAVEANYLAKKLAFLNSLAPQFFDMNT